MGKEIWWTLVHNQKSSRGAYWPTQVNFLRETTFRSLGVLPPQIFTRVTDWPRLFSAYPNGDGVPPKKLLQKFKFWPTIQRVSPYNFGASGNIFTNLFQVTWWTLVHIQKSYSVHIDLPKLHVHCKLTQVHMPHGSNLGYSLRSHSPTAIAARRISNT